MLFNTFSFALFLLITYTLYVLVFSKNLKVRNIFLLCASYFFYSCWNFKLLFVIIAVSAVDYLMGQKIQGTKSVPVTTNSNEEGSEPTEAAPYVPAKEAKKYLWIAILVNLGVLAYFKYTNFFLESIWDLLGLFGITSSAYSPLNIILPIGISFYCFQGLSYVIDVYKDKIKACTDPVTFFTFIAFFPQLVAGPIERAGNLLPQFDQPYSFNYEEARKGLFMIGAGLVKKMLIADRIAVYVDGVFGKLGDAGGYPSFLALVLFAFQLYLDFSAYSQIAVGTARMFGFKLSDNFKMPYLSVSFKDFWSRWHITLTNWFRDYLYFTLGGNRKGKSRTYINVLIVFAVSGLWHGASWNFFIWGLLNGIYLAIFDKVFHLNPQKFIAKVGCCLFVFFSWTFSLAFFRGANLHDALQILGNIGFSNIDAIYNFGLNSMELKFAFYLIAGLMLIELLLKNYGEKISNFFFNKFFIFRWAVYIAIPLALIYLGIYGEGNDNTFIYFQF
ncbi:MAG: MBOAT family protein [Paludibacteraceae bacterium]|nr:MBOAT family protein [Paludibacteraceae bacterium]